jgi:uncharacterized surface protein with fasciclin (FAS1) repeats
MLLTDLFGATCFGPSRSSITPLPLAMTILHRLTASAFALALVLTLSACGADEPDETVTVDETVEPIADNDIVAAATENGMTTLVTAVETAGLTETLRGEGPFTVFAPTNGAFDALPAGTLDTLMTEGQRAELTRILQYHVVPGRYDSSNMAGTITITTVAGTDLTVNATETGVTVTDAAGNTFTVVTPDVNVSNGVIHVIDGVLMPGEAPADSTMM